METKTNSQKFYKWKVSKAFSGKSLLFFLEQKLGSIPSKRALKKAIEKNSCFINSKRESFASKKVLFQDEVKLDIKWKEYLVEKVISYNILFEDESICVMDKPSGAISDEAFFKKKGLYLCHRLDKETTGVLLLAKNKKARDLLFKQFEKKTIEKEYVALVDRSLTKKQGVIESILVKKKSYQGQTVYGSLKTLNNLPEDGDISAYKTGGKTALTYWKCLDTNLNVSFVHMSPKTGRTHQLRVHLSEMGHPILGDFQYCKKFSQDFFVPRILLHSYKISFLHPISKEPISILSPIPKDFKECGNKLGLCLNVS